ncbi:helix-turn-helix domain-containing protein [Sphingomonas glaciei]|uniref:Helix-turn-helix domain-containing protein n=1 Tax=Sphingomonas glaciei TaxID=2938948 RepID=A0ABY5MT11_9SPHN|nr:helix-turn-helix domain-containing protein [Sphingomonas glaciei]UUR07645.1 helix-turn-helix domain-containing protein [Sphingomonas glaciei]
MDEVTSETGTVGEQLRNAREREGITLEDVAARTRIPTRHLQSLEDGEWDKLPAPMYTVGFAKSYAGMVGLDRGEIGDALKLEMGAGALAARPEAQVFEPADPARVMPRWLVLLALVALVAVAAAFLWNRNRTLSADDSPVAEAEAPATATQPAVGAAPVAATAPGGPVVITANEPTWIQVSERGGANLFQGELASGQSYEVPTTATAPVLRTGRPQSIRISVGTADAPAVGEADRTVSNVSLLGPDLMRGPGATPTTTPPTPQR